jgi:hypothetical protein
MDFEQSPWQSQINTLKSQLLNYQFIAVVSIHCLGSKCHGFIK